jgi:hypothetical protein
MLQASGAMRCGADCFSDKRRKITPAIRRACRRRLLFGGAETPSGKSLMTPACRMRVFLATKGWKVNQKSPPQRGEMTKLRQPKNNFAGPKIMLVNRGVWPN